MSFKGRMKLIFGRCEIICIAVTYTVYFIFVGVLIRQMSGFIPDAPMLLFKTPVYIQFILLPVYMFLLNRHDAFETHILCKTRYRGVFQAYKIRMRDMLVETAVFVLPLIAVLAIYAATSVIPAAVAVSGALNLIFGFLMVGVVCCTAALKWKIIVYLAVFALLTMDYTASMGWLPEEASVFYTPMLMVFMTKTGADALPYVLVSFAKLAVLAALSVLLIRGKRPRRRPRSSGPLWPQCVWAAGLGAVLTLFISLMNIENAEKAVLAVLGGMYTAEFPSMLLIAIYTVSILIQFYLFGGILPQDIDRSAAYLFSRRYNRRSWVLSKSLEVVGRSFLFSAVLTATVILGSVAVGSPPESWGRLGALVLMLIMTVWLCNAAFLLLSNILGLKLRPALAVLLSWMLYMPGLLITGLIGGGELLKKLWPSSQSVLPIHVLPERLSNVWEELFDRAVPGFTPVFSLVYSLVFIAALGAAGVLMMKKHDFTV